MEVCLTVDACTWVCGMDFEFVEIGGISWAHLNIFGRRTWIGCFDSLNYLWWGIILQLLCLSLILFLVVEGVFFKRLWITIHVLLIESVNLLILKLSLRKRVVRISDFPHLEETLELLPSFLLIPMNIKENREHALSSVCAPLLAFSWMSSHIQNKSEQHAVILLI